jgi:Rad3-related DNA helicase
MYMSGTLINDSSSILASFPYPQAREVQSELLQAIERDWNSTDVFVVVAPTASGKTAISRTIGKWAGDYSIITPTNLLVNQYLDEFPDEATIHKQSSYRCTTFRDPQQSCDVTKKKTGTRCHGCPYTRDMMKTKWRGGGIYNYHTYLAHRIYRETLIIDEAHNILPLIQDREGLLLWQHEYKWDAHTIRTYGDIRNWLNSLPEYTINADTKLRKLREDVNSDAPRYVIERTEMLWSQVKWAKGERPEDRPVLRVRPIDVRDAKPVVWPSRVKKLILMSATISPVDIEALGLSRRRVRYYECRSPIAPANRPIVFNPITSVNRSSMTTAIPRLMDDIINGIMPNYIGESGVIHCTYQMSALINDELNNNHRYESVRGLFMFHDRTNAKRIYDAWRMPHNRGRVLVACGMYEGLDIVQDLGRWQVIAKVPWPSLADPVVKHRADRNQDWYAWETLKRLIQACGRICRTPTDWGVTYILDSSFYRVYNNNRNLIPQWWIEALEVMHGE